MKMRYSTILRIFLGVAMSFPSVSQVTPEATSAKFRVIYALHDGPPVGLIEGSAGVFYYWSGGGPERIFSMTNQGRKTELAAVPVNQFLGALVSAANGRFYSEIQPERTVVSVSPTPGSKKIYPGQSIGPLLTQNLPDGMLLALGSDGISLMKCDLQGSIQPPIYQFAPGGGLVTLTTVYASDGNYYGVYAVHDGSGYVYRITSSGSLTQAVNFPPGTFSGYPIVPLLQASDGNIYGATPNGGANRGATVYRLTLSGQYTLLYTFPKSPMINPLALIEGSDGNLYGTTQGAGGISQLYRVTTSGQYTLLHQMTGNDGQCECNLTQGSDGLIYGTAFLNGPYGGGTIFSLDVGLPMPRPQAGRFNPDSGSAGTKVLIWGTNLLSASVQFNGVPAVTVSNSGPNYVWATVPAGATSGPLTITTPGGTDTTKSSFTVQ
jgi:hypothetical protein